MIASPFKVLSSEMGDNSNKSTRSPFKKKIDPALTLRALKAKQEYEQSANHQFELCYMKKTLQRVEQELNIGDNSNTDACSQDIEQSDNISGDSLIGFGTSGLEDDSHPVSGQTSGEANREASAETTPFDQETTVFANDHLKIYIFRKDFERQKKFSLDDHLFLLKIEALEGKPPLLLDIEDILMKACEDILRKIKAFYNQGK